MLRACPGGWVRRTLDRGRPASTAFGRAGVSPRHAVLLAGLAALAVPLHARVGSAVAPGARVRVRVRAEHDHIVGPLVGRVGDTLVVDASDGRRERLPVGTVGSFERSRGALWGAGIGVPILLLGGGAASGGETAGAVFAWTALGARIGAVRRPERWEGTPLPAVSPPAVAAAPPAPGGGPHRWPVLQMTSRTFRGGDRVRLRLTGGTRRVEGTVLGATADSLLIDRGGAPTPFALADVARADRYLGRSAAAGRRKYALIGAIPGAVLGSALGYVLSEWGGSNVSAGKRLGGTVLLGALGAAGTGSVGATVGAAVGADEWRRVPLESRVTLGPVGRGAALAVHVRFGAPRP